MPDEARGQARGRLAHSVSTIRGCHGHERQRPVCAIPSGGSFHGTGKGKRGHAHIYNHRISVPHDTL